MQIQNKEIIEFFKNAPGFERLLRLMYDLYSHSGRAFGAVRLTRPSSDEEAALSAFFRRDYYNQALIRIGLADFERQLQKNFPRENEGEFFLGEILAEYMGKPKKHTDEILQRGTPASVILAEILPKFEGSFAASWLKEISRQTRREYRGWVEQYNTDSEIALGAIQAVANAINNLPQGECLVPVAEFSQKFADSPDAFDFHNLHGQLFLKALAFKFGASATTTEDSISLHLRAGLLTCGKISGVSVYGLDGNFSAQMLTLEEISRLDGVSAQDGKAFIFEDPLIFNAVCEKDLPCTIVNPIHGAASMYLLEKLHAANVRMYYAGNLTAKGLEIADRLCEKFGKTIIPWRYEREDYEYALSKGSVIFPTEKKLLSLHNEQLASLLSLMRKTGKTASSKPLLSRFIEDISAVVTTRPASL